MGSTRFVRHNPDNEPGFTNVGGRRARKQKSSRPPDIWPEMWQMMSAKDRQEAIDAWKKLAPQSEAAVKRRAIYVETAQDDAGSLIPETS